MGEGLTKRAFSRQVTTSGGRLLETRGCVAGWFHAGSLLILARRLQRRRRVSRRWPALLSVWKGVGAGACGRSMYVCGRWRGMSGRSRSAWVDLRSLSGRALCGLRVRAARSCASTLDTRHSTPPASRSRLCPQLLRPLAQAAATMASENGAPENSGDGGVQDGAVSDGAEAGVPAAAPADSEPSKATNSVLFSDVCAALSVSPGDRLTA